MPRALECSRVWRRRRGLARSGAKRRHDVIALGSADEVGAALNAARAQALSPEAELAELRARVARCAALVGGQVRSATARRR